MITLAIIGVVAALTIPTVVKNYQKQQTVVKLKKSFNTLNQAINMAQVDYGSYENWDFSIGDPAFGDRYLAPYLKVMKKCAPKDDSCYIPKNFTKDLVGTNYWNLNTHFQTLVLSDGTTLFVDSTTTPLVFLFVDINGKNEPNMHGKDVFRFVLNVTDTANVNCKKKGLQSEFCTTPDSELTTGTYACKKTGSGGPKCTAYIIRNGWEMPDDYPW